MTNPFSLPSCVCSSGSGPGLSRLNALILSGISIEPSLDDLLFFFVGSDEGGDGSRWDRYEDAMA